MYLLLDPTSQQVFMFRTEAEHNHNEKIIGLPEATKLEVRKLFDLGIRKPNAVLKALASTNFPLPNKIQLENFLRTVRLSKGNGVHGSGFLRITN